MTGEGDFVVWSVAVLLAASVGLMMWFAVILTEFTKEVSRMEKIVNHIYETPGTRRRE